jgi:hypothetical protein
MLSLVLASFFITDFSLAEQSMAETQLVEPISDQKAAASDSADSPQTNQITQIWDDGTKYVGSIINGKREGKGTIIWPDGTRYVGHFKDDLRDGAGTMILPDGTIYNGYFVKGELTDPPVQQSEPAAPVADVSDQEILELADLFPPVTEITEPVRKEIVGKLKLWAAAWSDKNASQYLSYYHEDFKVPGKLSRRQWEILRRSRIKRPSTINVTLNIDKMSILDTNVVAVMLTQSYRSNLYSDITSKILHVKRDSQGDWRITAERITN